jgi:dihydrolipoamide dehydrogenase
MAQGDTWDIVVIGGGPPGEVAAQTAIEHSSRTAVIVEQELVGGECSYWACMPSKALLRPLEVLGAAASLAGTSSVVGDRVDVEAVLQRRDAFTSNHDDASQVAWATGLGIDVVRGHGRLAGIREVEVTAADGTTRTLRARHAVVLATGTSATVPPVPGLAAARPWTSRDVTNIHEIPRRMAIIGGGVVACEAATWLIGLGVAELTMIVSGPTLLANDEPFAGQLVAEHLSSLGVDIRFSTTVVGVSRPGVAETGEGLIRGGAVHITVPAQTITVDEIAVATGRTPNSADLDWERVGLSVDGFVPVDDHLGVKGLHSDPAERPWLYAVGDVNGRALLTHMGKYQARVAGAVISARADGRPIDGPEYRDQADHDRVPQVTFTDPQVASVGLTEQAARDRSIDVETVEYDIGAVAGASLLRDGYTGRAKLVLDRARDVIVGATFVGPEVAELVHAATIAVVGEVPLATLWHAVPSYPTVSEIWLRLLETRAANNRS